MKKKKYTRHSGGGLTKGKSHAKGGIKMTVKDTGQKIEVEGGEGIINKYVMSSEKKHDFEGKDMTACEIASTLNQSDGNGVRFDCDETKNTDMTPTDPSTGFAKGGDVISEKIKFLMEEEGYPQDQATAIAYSMQERGKLAKGGNIFNTPNPETKKIAQKYIKDNADRLNLSEPYASKVYSVDTDRAIKIADKYDQLDDEPNNTVVQKAYKEMADETIAQYKAVTDKGYELELWDGKGEPYANSKEMLADVRDNKHLYIFSTESGFGKEGISKKMREQNAMLQKTKYKDVNGKPLLVNDLFRFVHDFFGHTELGNGFGAIGEENAWLAHSRMFSPEARKAMTMETRGQNSWVNFGKHIRRKDNTIPKKGDADYIKLADRPFADQKMNIMPDKYVYSQGGNIRMGDDFLAENSDDLLVWIELDNIEKVEDFDLQDGEVTVFNVNEIDEALDEWNEQLETNYSTIEDFNRGEEYRAIMKPYEFLEYKKDWIKDNDILLYYQIYDKGGELEKLGVKTGWHLRDDIDYFSVDIDTDNEQYRDFEYKDYDSAYRKFDEVTSNLFYNGEIIDNVQLVVVFNDGNYESDRVWFPPEGAQDFDFSLNAKGGNLPKPKEFTQFQMKFATQLDRLGGALKKISPNFYIDSHAANFAFNKIRSIVYFDIENLSYMDEYSYEDRIKTLDKMFPNFDSNQYREQEKSKGKTYNNPYDKDPYKDSDFVYISKGAASLGVLYYNVKEDRVYKFTNSPFEAIGTYQVMEAQKKDSSYNKLFPKIYSVEYIGNVNLKGTLYGDNAPDMPYWLIQREEVTPFNDSQKKQAQEVENIILDYYNTEGLPFALSKLILDRSKNVYDALHLYEQNKYEIKYEITYDEATKDRASKSIMVFADSKDEAWRMSEDIVKKANPYFSKSDLSVYGIKRIRNNQYAKGGDINWFKSKDGKGDPAITKKNIDNVQALKDYGLGKITYDEYLDISQSVTPIKEIDTFYEPATYDEIFNALAKQNQTIKNADGEKVLKQEVIDAPIKKGQPIGVRLDIPSYVRYNTWVVSIHDGHRQSGRPISYQAVVRIKDVTFGTVPSFAFKIAIGDVPKNTIGRMYGYYDPIAGNTAEERAENTKKLIEEISNNNNWKQVGMNPFRHSYFYLRENGMPVVSADEVVQIGGLVYAKNAKTVSPKDEMFRAKHKDYPYLTHFNKGGMSALKKYDVNDPYGTYAKGGEVKFWRVFQKYYYDLEDIAIFNLGSKKFYSNEKKDKYSNLAYASDLVTKRMKSKNISFEDALGEVYDESLKKANDKGRFAKGGVVIEGNPYKNEDFFIYRGGKEVVSWNADELREDDYARVTAEEMYDLFNNNITELTSRLDNLNYAKGGKVYSEAMDDFFEEFSKAEKDNIKKVADYYSKDNKDIVKQLRKYIIVKRNKDGLVKQISIDFYDESSDTKFKYSKKYAKGGKVSDLRRRVAEVRVDMEQDSGLYEEELGEDFTYEQAVEWELKNSVRDNEEAKEYADEYGMEYDDDFAKGGITRGFTGKYWVTLYNDRTRENDYYYVDAYSRNDAIRKVGRLPKGWRVLEAKADEGWLKDGVAFAKGGDVRFVEKRRYVVEWRTEDGLESEYFDSNELDLAKDFYKTIDRSVFSRSKPKMMLYDFKDHQVLMGDEDFAKGGRLNQEQKIYLKDLFYNVRDKEDNRIKKTFNKLDELGVSFRIQNEVIALAEESRTKNLNADDVTKLLSKYAKGGSIKKYNRKKYNRN